MEEQSGATGWRTNSPTPRPGQIRLWTYQAIAHGADAVVYFRWRTCRFGTEEYWHGILNHDGKPQRRYREVAEIGQELAAHAAEWQDTSSHNDVAILMAYDVNWSLQIHPHSPRFSYWSHLRKFYDTLYHMGIGVDVVRPGADLRDYKLVIAPTLYVVSPATREALRSYVKQGGALITTFRSFVKNPANVVSDRVLPADMDDVLGILIHEYDVVPASCKNRIVSTDGETAYDISTWADVIELQGAQVQAVYEGEFYAGAPAVTVSEFGLGRAHYIGTCAQAQFYRDMLAAVTREAGVEPLLDPAAGVEVVRRVAQGVQFLFVLNHRAEPAQVQLPQEHYSLLDETDCSGQVTLDPYGVLVLKREV